MGIRKDKNVSATLSPPLSAARTMLVGAAVLVLLSIPSFFAWRAYEAHLSTESHDIVDKGVRSYQDVVETRLSERLGQLRGLTAFVISNRAPGELDKEFETFSQGLVAQDPGVRAVEIAPSGVIDYVYPLAGNEAALGADLTRDKRDAVRRDVKRGIATKQTIVGGPYELLQGGRGFVAREPIFDPDGGFYGMTQIVFNVSQLVKEAGLDNESIAFDVGLRARNGGVLYESGAVFSSDPIVHEITVPGGNWEIAAAPKGGWVASTADDRDQALVMGAVILLLLTVIITGAVERQRRLARAIGTRTGELTEANERLAHLNRLYSMLTGVNQAIVKTDDMHFLFDDVCRIVVDDGGFRMCWVGLVDASDESVYPAAIAGKADDYLENIAISAKDMPEGRGPTGTAIRENRPVVASDIVNDPIMEPWRERALQRGYLSSAAFPITMGGKPVGAVMVYDDKTGSFNDEERTLLEEIAANVSFALDKMTQAHDLKHAASFPLKNPSPIIELSASGVIMFYNEAATRELEKAGSPGQYERFKPADFEVLAKTLRGDASMRSGYGEVDIEGRVYAETLVYAAENDAIRIYTMDITDKKNYEMDLVERQEELVKSYKDQDRMLTMFTVLSEVNERMLRIGDRKRLSQAVCDTLVANAGYELGVMLLKEPQKGRLKPYTWAGQEDGFVPFLDDYLTSLQPDDPLFGELLKKKKHVVCIDMSDPKITPRWREEAVKAGFAIFGIFPLLMEGQVEGAIIAFSSDPGL